MTANVDKMNVPRRAVRPYKQRPAYQPTDPIAFLKLQQLPCVRSGDEGLGPEYLDPAGIFHQICHFCDSQKRFIKPDLTFILNKIETREEPDMSWIKGFYDGNRKRPALPKPSPAIDLLPPIQEDREVDVATLDHETPAKKRLGDQRHVRVCQGIEVAGHSGSPQLQWTPKAKARQEADIL
ncbi:MAG: hypothetical protein Q9169_005545, partial [Polycauliona sp. 2 TL-2023]